MAARPSAAAVSMTVLAGTATVLAGTAVGAEGNAADGRGTRVVSVEQGAVEATVTARGALGAAHDAVVDFQAGGRIERIYVEDGDHVDKGQLPARLDDTAQRAALARPRRRWPRPVRRPPAVAGARPPARRPRAVAGARPAGERQPPPVRSRPPRRRPRRPPRLRPLPARRRRPRPRPPGRRRPPRARPGRRPRRPRAAAARPPLARLRARDPP